MIDFLKFAKQLELHEGLRLKPYRCTAGKLTIGIGRNLDDTGITKAEAYELLSNDIDRVVRECGPYPWWDAVKNDPVRSRVILDMAFNMGIKGLTGFKNTLAAVAAKDWPRAAKGMRGSLWAKQVKERATRLARMMETGQDEF